MPAAKPNPDSRYVTSALIELIIKLPEHEQESLLRVLQTRFQTRHSKAAPCGPKSADERSGEYASGRYFYWDLFSL